MYTPLTGSSGTLNIRSRPMLQTIITATCVLIFLYLFLATSPSIPRVGLQQQYTYPDPVSCTGVCNGLRDPAILRRASDGRYFRLITGDNIKIASAPTLTGPWVDEGSMLADGSIIKIHDDQGLWAPDCIMKDQVAYCYYSVSTMGSQDSDIGLATSTELMPGTWTDHGSIGLPQDSRWNKIDANLLYISNKAQAYVTFGSGWDGIFQIAMQPDLKRMQPGADVISLERNDTIAPFLGHPAVMEGSFIFEWRLRRKSWYYLFFSSGACCNPGHDLPPPGEEYKIMVCRSDRPSGGFVDVEGRECRNNGGTQILGSHGDVYAPGGQGVFLDNGSNRVIMYYHYVKPSSGGYEWGNFHFGFNYLDFSSGWPVMVQ